LTRRIALIRQGINGLLEIGTRVGIAYRTVTLAAAQEREGAIADALETIEQALQVNPDELVDRPEALRLRGELQLKREDNDAAVADLREAIGVARRNRSKTL
jgi:tetratricopeptide (TPR) repeat protein